VTAPPNQSTPREYRVRYRLVSPNNHALDGVLSPQEEAIASYSRLESRYYSVFHSSEALQFLAHNFRTGKIHGSSCIEIVSVEERNRWNKKWEDRTEKALDHADVPELNIINSKIYLSHAESTSTR
jgi:hypothetical protein